MARSYFKLHHTASQAFAVWLCIFSLLPLSTLRAANEEVTLTTVSGGDSNDGVFANASGTPTNGYTVRVAVFSETQAEVLSLSYNSAWIENKMSVFGENVTAAQGSPPPLDGSFGYVFLNSSDTFKNKQAWLVYSTGSNLTASASYGIVTSTDSSWVIANSNPWQTTLNINDINRVGYGSTDSLTSYNGTVRVAADPTALYWDSNDGAGLGGDGTWSTTSTEWTTNSGGVGTSNTGTGPYAWGTTSDGNFQAGAGLTAHFGGTAGTVTVSGTVQAHNGLTFASNSYSLTSGTINLAGGSAAANTITVTSSGHTATISASLTGSNGTTKAGDGTARLDGTNTYTGSTTINAGTLQADAANSLQSTSGITVNTGGSLLVSATNAVNDSATINLAGGTVAMSGSGISDTVGTLTLSANSVIDLSNASGARTLTFADSSAINWTGTSLQIWHWNGTNMYGTSYGDADRKIFFGNSASGLSETQLGKISFWSGSGTGFIGNAFIRSNGEIAAIPEPEVYATALLLLAGLGIRYYRRRRAQALPVAA